MTDRQELRAKIAALLHQTSEDHHVAYASTDGVDADWSIWYAGHLLEKGFATMLQASILKSDLIYLLVSADKEIAARAPGAHWETYYGDFFIERYVH
jgi:hypothetical protein